MSQDLHVPLSGIAPRPGHVVVLRGVFGEAEGVLQHLDSEYVTLEGPDGVYCREGTTIEIQALLPPDES